MLTRLLILLAAISTISASTQNGTLILDPMGIDAAMGQVRLFVTPTGTGDCSSWTNACTFRNMIAKLDSSKMEIVYVSAGDHNLNNGSDGTGTTIADNYLHITGMGNTIGTGTRFYNSHATASKVLTFTGDYVIIENAIFTNSDQTDPNVTFLTLTGTAQTIVERSFFVQAPTDGGGTGIKIDGSSSRIAMYENKFTNVLTYGIHTDGVSSLVMKDTEFLSGGTGFYMAGTSDTAFAFERIQFVGLTTGMSVAALTGTVNNVNTVTFCNCTTAIADLSDYKNVSYVDVVNTNGSAEVYPATTGTTLDTGDGIWAWSAAQDIIPENTITTPFIITGINVQDWSAEQIYKIQLLEGDTTPTTSIGIFEIRLGDPLAKKAVAIPVTLRKQVSANATVGAKVMSSTDGVDTVTITLSYEKL